MKKATLSIALLGLGMILAWCGTKDQKIEVVEVEVDPVQLIENLKVTDDDMNTFDMIVGGEWVSENDDTNIFTFGPSNTFVVQAWELTANGPWIVSEGKILLWDRGMELIIVDDSTITISGKTYMREVWE